MRIRSIKPEFYRSTDITVLDWETRLIFIALWSYVDDNGVGIDKLSSIVADLFADDLEQDPEATFARVSRGLQQLSANGRIARYTCDNKKYLYITNWPKHQKIDRPNKARYPLPDNKNPENTRQTEQIATPSREYREGPSTGTEEQGNRGTEEQGNKAPSKPPASTQRPPSRFDEFWNWYPRKVGKEAAKKAWDKARTKTDQQIILDGIERYRLDPNLPGKEFIPHPATWLNEGRWEDEPLPQRGQQQRPNAAQTRLQTGYDLLQETRAEISGQLEIGAR